MNLGSILRWAPATLAIQLISERLGCSEAEAAETLARLNHDGQVSSRLAGKSGVFALAQSFWGAKTMEEVESNWLFQLEFDQRELAAVLAKLDRKQAIGPRNIPQASLTKFLRNKDEASGRKRGQRAPVYEADLAACKDHFKKEFTREALNAARKAVYGQDCPRPGRPRKLAKTNSPK